MTWVWFAMRIKKEKPENDSKYESKSWCEVADGWSKSCWAEFYAFIVTQLTWKPASPPKHKIIKIRSNTNFTSEFFFWNCVLLIWQFSHFKKKISFSHVCGSLPPFDWHISLHQANQMHPSCYWILSPSNLKSNSKKLFGVILSYPSSPSRKIL